jgi:hypothetical protein
MINVIKVISTSLDQLSRRVVKFYRFGNSDVATSLEVGPYGTDSNPVKNMVALSVKTGTKGETFVIGYINKQKLAELGEHRTFSTDEDGVLKTYIWLKNDGTIEIGGDSDNMVRFSALETAFNELKGDFNTFIQGYNTHTHPTPSGVSSPPVIGGTQSAADISGAKIDEIKTL